MKCILRAISIFLITAVLVVHTPIMLAMAASEFAGGSGTPDDPYLVSTPEQLNEVRYNRDKFFLQINDIDLFISTTFGSGAYYHNGKGWKPIELFTGCYDGGGYAVKNLYMDRIEPYMGLFEFNGGTIKNLGMENGTIKLRNNNLDSYSVGGIVGYNSGTISNCYNDLTSLHGRHNSFSNISSYNVNMGGIAGQNVGVIVNCYNTAEIIEDMRFDSFKAPVFNGYIGGITGRFGSGTISNCYNTGNVKVYFNGAFETSSSYLHLSTNIGGIAGYIDSGTISDCYNKGWIDGQSLGAIQNNIGGIAGTLRPGGFILNCYYTGWVRFDGGSKRIGDILGNRYNGTVVGCYYTFGTTGVGDNENEGTESKTLDEIQDKSFVDLLNHATGSSGAWLPDDANVNGGCPIFFYNSSVRANVPSGMYAGAQAVSLTAAVPGAQIYYTLDGSNPKTNGILYGGPVTVNATLILKIAAKVEDVWSNTSQYNYFISTEAEKPNEETYAINRMFFTDIEGSPIDISSRSSFVCNVEIIKNLERSRNDYVIMAAYDTDNRLIAFSYLRPHMELSETYEMGTLMTIPAEKTLGKVKAFVWEGLSQPSGISDLSTPYVYTVGE